MWQGSDTTSTKGRALVNALTTQIQACRGALEKSKQMVEVPIAARKIQRLWKTKAEDREGLFCWRVSQCTVANKQDLHSLVLRVSQADLKPRRNQVAPMRASQDDMRLEMDDAGWLECFLVWLTVRRARARARARASAELSEQVGTGCISVLDL